MNETNDLMKQVTDAVGALWALPVRVVLFALCIALAQLLKKSPKIENWLIPWICTFAGGGLSWLVLSEVPNAAVTPKTNVLMGCLSGYIAHIVHFKILANPESKFPIIGGVLCGETGETKFIKPNDTTGLP